MRSFTGYKNVAQWCKIVLNSYFHVLDLISIGVLFKRKAWNSKIRLLRRLSQENHYQTFFLGHPVCEGGCHARRHPSIWSSLITGRPLSPFNCEALLLFFDSKFQGCPCREYGKDRLIRNPPFPAGFSLHQAFMNILMLLFNVDKYVSQYDNCHGCLSLIWHTRRQFERAQGLSRLICKVKNVL